MHALNASQEDFTNNPEKICQQQGEQTSFHFLIHRKEETFSK